MIGYLNHGNILKVCQFKIPRQRNFQNFDYCPINYTLYFTLKSMGNACFTKDIVKVT